MNSKLMVIFVILIVIASLYYFGETKVILTILGLSTIVFILESVGFLPLTISRFINKNRLGATIDVLNELGFDVREKRKIINKCQTQDLSARIEGKLKKITINKEVEIGKSQNGHIYPEYIDLMGATTFKRNATDFARELNTYKETLKLEFDFIVTSKLGSPILGYEFANLLEVPFVLHSEEEKFRLKKGDDASSKFDFGCLENKKLKKALIIDDSTTGGRKVINIIKDLKKYGFEVTDCLVVFAPQGKQADERLAKENVKLHSIVQTPIKN
ncbi:MAG: phosphoribosyltransferase [Sulfurimonas sp.]|uniref:phosphoribosyltransferase n=1 Tax=Sulfurimonas sp. TaxID=2022749 RepID=UPI0028CDFEC0|nr:phosphoribosyltransferase [Sulfurimonas sp.]MDT8339497.1 phosphoribosyltransferase [Sulfurimonas sp.]